MSGVNATEEFLARWYAHDHKPAGELDYVPTPSPAVIVYLIERVNELEGRLNDLERQTSDEPMQPS